MSKQQTNPNETEDQKENLQVVLDRTPGVSAQAIAEKSSKTTVTPEKNQATG
mgnify:CR=1 FL=1